MLLLGRPSNSALKLMGDEGTQEGSKLAVVEAIPEVFSPV